MKRVLGLPVNRKQLVAITVLLASMCATVVSRNACGDSSTESQFARKLAMCEDGDVACQLSAAKWAASHGLWKQADAVYREILSNDPADDDAYEYLLKLHAGRKLETDSEVYRTTRKLLPKSFLEYETKRFVVLSNAAPAWTREQLERLERAQYEYTRYTRRMNLRPLPMQHKLVCVLFQERRQYEEFARTYDQIQDSWVFGYYSPRFDRIVFYNGEAEDGKDDFTRNRSIATTIHEAVHQLHFHTRVQTIHVQYPLWICEGLATSFETNSPNTAFGPEHDFEPRRSRFEAILEKGELLPLKELVQLDRLPSSSDGTIVAVYNESYALVSWLARHERASLNDYLMLMLREPPGRPDAGRHLELFERAFGDIDRIEQRWLRDERAALASMPRVPNQASTMASRHNEWPAIDQPLLGRHVCRTPGMMTESAQ